MESLPSIEAAFLAYRCTREPAALAQVYDNASARLLSVAMHLTKSPATAEDVVQDTFLVALENPDRWDETKPLMPWLLGILSNRVRQVDGLSRRAVDPARLLVPDATDPQESSEATELLAHVDDAITHLPQPYRSVVLLRLRNGLSPADISIALGRNPNTVRTQLARGVEMLRKVLPSSVAVLLAGSLAASAGQASSRRVVLQKAAEAHRRFRAVYRLAALRRALMFAGLAVIGLVAWGLVSGLPVAPLEPALVAEGVASDRISQAAATAPAVVESAAASRHEREESITLGSAAVTVLARGVAVPSAAVELEPLGDPPRVLVHSYAYPNRKWRSIVPALPLARDYWRAASTAADGCCAFDELAPGYWVCRSLGLAVVFRVEAGQCASLRLNAPGNTAFIRGVVLDANGLPVAQAPIWKLNRQVQASSVIATHSDERGRFAISVPARVTLGAFLRGYAPVAITVSPAGRRPRRDVVLQFREPGARVVGHVIDAHGRPCRGAVVEVGQVGDLGVGAANDEPKVLARVHRTTTNFEGQYCFDSLVPGRTVLRARSEGHGVCQQSIDLRADVSAERELRLVAEAVLEGVVRGASGAPEAGVLVRVGAPQSFGSCSAVTDGHGRYRLSGLSPGRCSVAATNLRGGFAWCDLSVQAGERLVWDARMCPENLTIEGRVVDEYGAPLSGGWLEYHHVQGGQVQQLGAEGDFSLVVAERDAEIPGTLRFYRQDPRGDRRKLLGDVLAVVSDVRPRVARYEVRVRARATECSLRGRIATESGVALEGSCVLVGARGLRRWRRRFEPGPDGSFELTELEEGTYTLRIEGASSGSFGPIELTPARLHDMGMLRVSYDELAAAEVSCRFSFLFKDRVVGRDALTLEVYDQQKRLVHRRFKAASSNGGPSLLLMLPAGSFEVRATSAMGVVATRALRVDANVRRRRSVLVEFE